MEKLKDFTGISETHVGQIIKCDIANGPGIRLSVFLSGCMKHCKGCFQPETWDINYGKLFTKEIFDDIIEELAKPQYQGITLLGGEPLGSWNIIATESLISYIKKNLPDKDIWVYTGFTLEEIDSIHYLYPKLPFDTSVPIVHYDIALPQIDVLVEGPFIEEKKDPTLLFRGSSNQRLIDMKKTIKNKKICLWEKKY